MKILGQPTADDGGDEGTVGTLVDKINYCIRKSRVFSRTSTPTIAKDNAPQIRWRKGELIGCGAFGRVYMGMNLDSGELLAVKQVSIAANSASKEKAQVTKSTEKASGGVDSDVVCLGLVLLG
uniref:mitogen-activated protein kinase kinase kinase n=1 Tax=Davidia involucrata TaxID=16924 RepID=A0A5B7A3B2_DAVIN